MTSADSAGCLMTLSSVCFSYAKEEVLHDISLEIRPGRIIGVIGDNGLGKSTLLALMAGLCTPDSGQVRRHTASVSYALPPGRLPASMRARDLLFYYRAFFSDFDESQARQLLLSYSLPEGRALSRFSKGQASLLCLILALSRRSKLYLMDEPLAGIDPYFKKDIRRFLLEHMPEGSTLVMSTHLLRELEFLLDEFILITHGQAVLHDAEAIRQTYGLSVEQYYLKEAPHG